MGARELSMQSVITDPKDYGGSRIEATAALEPVERYERTVPLIALKEFKMIFP
jgi:hypothetical protein